MADPEDFNAVFAPPGSSLPDDVNDELHAIARLHSLPPQELFYKWESYVMKMGVDNTVMDYKTIKDFRKDLQDALDREARAKAHGMQSASKKTAATPRAGAVGGAALGMIDGMTTTTPSSNQSKRRAGDLATPTAKSVKSRKNSTPASGAAPPAVEFAQRRNAGQTVETINGKLPAAVALAAPSPEPRVRLKANTELPKFAYKGMAMKLSEASEILDDRIDMFTELVQEHHQLEDAVFGNPAAQSTAEIVAVGRITCDTPNGKLNPASLVLETSRRMGAGMRVPLRFVQTGYDLFPGKIVALRGTNVSGEYFAVTEVISVPLLPPAASSVAELDANNSRLVGVDGEPRPLHMLVASGPYTTDVDLSFAPFEALLSKAEEFKSDVLLLTGPFIDLEHPLVASGNFVEQLPPEARIDPDRATVADIFRVLVAQPLARLAQAVPSITVIMVPSVRDAINKHVSWPQDRFQRAPLGLPKQVQVVTNPITLSINEIVVGVSAHDILTDLHRDYEYQASVYQPNANSFQNDLLARLSNAVIEQRHYYPIFPPPARENLLNTSAVPSEATEAEGARAERLAVGANVDLGYLKLGEWLNVRPDVLLLPSTLTPFAKVVNAVTCLNPGTLSKKRGPGTYLSMAVHPRRITDEERAATPDAVFAHNVFWRARVDVVRI